MSQMKHLREEYVRLTKLSSKGTMDGTPASIYKREGIRNSAKRQLNKVEIELLALITGNSVTVSLLDDIKDLSKFEELAKNNDNVFMLSYRLIDQLASKTIYPSEKANGYPINSEFISKLNAFLSGDISYRIDADYMPLIKSTASVYGVAKTREELLAKISKFFHDTYGDDLNNIFLRKTVNEEIFKRLSHDKVIAIIADVPFEALSSVSSMTGRSTFISSLDVPGSIKFNAEMSLSDLRKSIGKAVSTPASKNKSLQ